NWYPNNASLSLGEYSSYDMTFRIPKGMKIVATSSLISESRDGGQEVTVWKSEVPLTVAGFNFGKFKVEESKVTKPEYLVQSYANEEPPDWVTSLRGRTRHCAYTGFSHGGAGGIGKHEYNRHDQEGAG